MTTLKFPPETSLSMKLGK